MKRVFFTTGGSKLLTNKEYEEAKVCWMNGSVYYCRRLDDIISPHIAYTETDKDDEMYDAIFYSDFLEPGKIWRKICKKGDNFFLVRFSQEGKLREDTEIPIDKMSPESLDKFLSSLISEDDYWIMVSPVKNKKLKVEQKDEISGFLN